MKALIVYECEHCKKLFRTPNRHYCKMNPELKNCWTCKHLKGWKEGERDFDYQNPPYPDCEYCEPCDWDLDTIKDVNYNMQCEHWEQGKYDWTELYKKGD